MGSIKKCHSHNWIIYEYDPKKCENGIEYENEMKLLLQEYFFVVFKVVYYN